MSSKPISIYAGRPHSRDVALTAALLMLANAGAAIAAEPETIVVTAPGSDADVDDAIRIDGDALRRTGRPDLIATLGREVAGVSLSEAQANPYQPNLIYRGFSASPLQGNAQGLAVYLDGGRFNLPFGDTVNFDLLPDAAIDSVSIRDANPIFGMNALGGSVVLATKTGRSTPVMSANAAFGDHGRAEASVSAGWTQGGFSGFVAGQARRDDGWRDFSPSTLYNGFADVGWDGESGGLHLKLVGADTDLTGNGTAPVELLEADYGAVFTHPDNTRNRYVRGSLHPWIALGENSRLEASLYLQSFRQRTLNGDAADIEGCSFDASLLCLSDASDNENILRDASGAAVADTLGGEGYGALNRSRTRSNSVGILAQYVLDHEIGSAANQLTVGFSHDRSSTRFASSSELGELTEDRSVEGLGPIITQPDGSVSPVRLDVTARQTGVFLSDTLSLSSRLTAELGLRWNHVDIELKDRIGTALNGRHRFKRLNPGLEFDYRVSQAVSVRAGYAETSRAPTPAELSCADEAAPCSLTNFFVGDPPLEQVVGKTWEAGASGDLAGDWAGQWLLSAYRTRTINDIQFTAASTRGRAFFRNIGTTTRRGVEASLSAARGAMSVRLGYAFTDARFGTALVVNSPDNPEADDDGRIFVEAGDRIPGIPRHRVVASADYDFGSLSLGADLQAQSGQYLRGDESNDAPRTDGFATLDLRGEMKLGKSARLFAHVTNVFNARYATFGTFTETDEIELDEVPGADNPRALSPGAPRRFLLGMRLEF